MRLTANLVVFLVVSEKTCLKSPPLITREKKQGYSEPACRRSGQMFHICPPSQTVGPIFGLRNFFGIKGESAWETDCSLDIFSIGILTKQYWGITHGAENWKKCDILLLILV